MNMKFLHIKPSFELCLLLTLPSIHCVTINEYANLKISYVDNLEIHYFLKKFGDLIIFFENKNDSLHKAHSFKSGSN